MWSLPRFRAICAFASKERQRPKTRSHPPGDAARPRSPWTHHEVGSFRTKGAEPHPCPKRPDTRAGLRCPRQTKLRPVSVRWTGARTRTSPMTGVRPVAASPGSESRIDAISSMGSPPQSPPCRRTISPGMTGADHQTTAGGRDWRGQAAHGHPKRQRHDGHCSTRSPTRLPMHYISFLISQERLKVPEISRRISSMRD